MASPENKRWIYVTLAILSIVTIVEVALGIIKPGVMLLQLMGTSLLNITFIVLTLVKAYYIVWYFMHVKFEAKGFRRSLTLPLYILIPYLTAILLVEGGLISL